MERNIVFRQAPNSRHPCVTAINPKLWGPMYWSGMFMRAGRYEPTPSEKKEVRYMFISLKDELPCKLCRKSYAELLIRYPIDDYLNSKRCLLTWLYLIKDSVNRKLICQERKEYVKVLEKITSNPHRMKIAEQKLYTKPSPPLETVLSKWSV